MSFRDQQAASRVTGLKGTEYKILGHLADRTTHGEPTHYCGKTTAKAIARALGVSYSATKQAVRALSEYGLIKLAPVRGEHTGYNAGFESWLVMPFVQPSKGSKVAPGQGLKSSSLLQGEEKTKGEEKKDFKKLAEETGLEDSSVSISTGDKTPDPEKTRPDHTQTGTSSLEDSPSVALGSPTVFATQPCDASDVLSSPDVIEQPVVSTDEPMQAAEKLCSPQESTDKGTVILLAYRCEKPSTKQIVEYWCEQERYWFPKAAGRRLKKKQGKGPLYRREFFPLMNLFERTYNNAEPAFELVHKVFSNWTAIRERPGASTYPTPLFIADNEQLLWAQFDEGLYSGSNLAGPKPYVHDEPTGSGGLKFLTIDGHIDHEALAESLATKFGDTSTPH